LARQGHDFVVLVMDGDGGRVSLDSEMAPTWQFNCGSILFLAYRSADLLQPGRVNNHSCLEEIAPTLPSTRVPTLGQPTGAYQRWYLDVFCGWVISSPISGAVESFCFSSEDLPS
jgi:hypothetical protein